MAFALAAETKQHGLKCDTQCMIDTVRVLRIPHTFNCKSDPPLGGVIGGRVVIPATLAITIQISAVGSKRRGYGRRRQ